jgi:hypothetical protein
VVRFDFRDRPLERFWLLLQRPHPEVCITHPGGDDDLIVYTDASPAWLTSNTADSS